MHRVPINRIEPGMILARPVALDQIEPGFVLPREYALPADLVPKLAEHGVQEIWVRSPHLEFLDDIFDEELADHQRAVYRQVRCNFERILRRTTPEIDLHDFSLSLKDLFGYLKQNQCSGGLLQRVHNYDNYLLTHSTNVCYLSLLLQMNLQDYIAEQQDGSATNEADQSQLLGMGCLLHDVGKTQVPAAILNKPTRLTPQEMELVRQHPVLGYEMVRGQVPAVVADVVLNHHQRFNGQGYPRHVDPRTGMQLPSLAGARIPIFTRIATVVDVYDAATSRRCYSGAKPPVQVLHEMRTQCLGFFDPVVEEAFYRIVPPFPVGQIVTLSDGVEAVVVDFNPDAPAHPKVEAIRDPGGAPYADPSSQQIDLAGQDDLEIVEVDHVDVRPFLPSRTPVLALAGDAFGDGDQVLDASAVLPGQPG